MIIFPTAYVIPRGIHILLSICLALFIFPQKFRFDKFIILLSLIMYTLCIFALMNGLIKGNDIVSSILLYTAWPLVFLLLSSYSINKEDFVSLEKTIINISTFGCILVLVGVILILFFGKNFFYEEIFPVELGFVYGVPKIGSQFLPILCFTIPFTFFWMIDKSKSSRNHSFFLFAFMVFFSLLTGRSVFLLMFFALTILIIFHVLLTSNRSSKSILKYSIYTTIILYLLYISFPDIFNTSFDILYKKVFGIYDEKLGSSRRLEQSINLYQQIYNNPMFGMGINATELPGRSEVIAFELTYLQIILNFGIVGFTLLLFGNFTILFNLFLFFYRHNSINVLAPWIYGYLIYLLCAFTNPILLKFDRLWILWIPVFLYLNRHKIICAK